MSKTILLLLLLASPCRGEAVLSVPNGLQGPGRNAPMVFGPSAAGTLIECKGDNREVSNLSVDGQAGLHDYAWGRGSWVTAGPDLGGPDAPHRADGLVVSGNNFLVSNAQLKQIPGNGMILSGVWGTGRDIYVEGSRNGIVLESNDSKYHNLIVGNSIEDGIVVAAQGNVIIGDHVSGAGKAACRIKCPSRFVAAYHEAAPIGTDIEPGADGTIIDGLDIGPGSCWERGVRIGANGCAITGLRGTVQLNSPEHPDNVGVEIMPGLVHTVVAGDLVIDWDRKRPDAKAVGVIIRGDRCKVDLKGGWNGPTGATYVRCESTTGSTIEIVFRGDGGCVLDATGAVWNDVDVKISGTGTAVRLKPPKSATNCKVEIDGVVVNLGERK